MTNLIFLNKSEITLPPPETIGMMVTIKNIESISCIITVSDPIYLTTDTGIFIYYWEQLPAENRDIIFITKKKILTEVTHDTRNC